MVYLAWVIMTAFFYVLSLVFKGKGTFNRTLEFVGYGYLPQLIGAAIGAVLIYQFATTATVTPISDMTAIQDAINALMKDPLIQLSTFVSAVFLVWSANIWIFGLKYARSLTTKSAALTVGLPVALYLAYMLYTAVVA
ncbi:MAG: hypothetical protein EHJ95_03845 [Methanobacteriota archaeon]|nr:MAG: hypothetical protein EHJ95_03845 [Euryarchaeota archaeon]